MKLTRWLSIALLVGLGPGIAPSQDSAETPVLLSHEYFVRRDTTDKEQPEYPEVAQQAGIQGMVLVFVVFDRDGKVVEVKPLASPHELLSEAVIKAVKKWRMTTKPYQYVPDSITWGELRFIFSLEDGKGVIRDAPDEEQRKPSEEYKSERMRRNRKMRQQEKVS